MERVLIIGGTGMMQGVTLTLVERGMQVTVLARHREKMEKMCQEIENPEGKVHFIEADYRDREALRKAIAMNMRYFGAFDKVIAWIHAHGYQSHLDVAELTANSKLHYYQVLGSMSRDPHGAPDKVAAKMEKMNMHYHQLVLGFVVEEKGSRWLTHHEVCDGILDGLEQKQCEIIIGQVEPWEDRP